MKRRSLGQTLEHDTFITHNDMDGGPRVQGDGSRFDKMPYTFEKWTYE